MGSMKRVELEKQSELRIEVGEYTPLRIRLLSGTAEIFGSELPPETWHTFPPCYKFAVFTWFGATIEMEGTTETYYTADETPMVSYVNVHAILDGRRNLAKASSSRDSGASQGPRVIVVGDKDSGKSSLCRMLVSWAAKKDWKPIFADLDIGQGSLTIPGCIAAAPMVAPIAPLEEIPPVMSLVYFYAHTTASNNVDLYKALVNQLAQSIERRFAHDAESRAAGMVINTMGWIERTGYELLLDAIHTFKANVALVLGQEKLFSMLNSVLKGKPDVDVVKLQKSGGVVSRNTEVRQKSRSNRIKEYFYGITNDLSPVLTSANFSDLLVHRIGGTQQAPKSAMLIAADPIANPLGLTLVNIDQDLLHTVLAVSYAKTPDQILSSNVAGFIYITNIDMERKKIKYLSPADGELPGKYLIVGTLKCPET